MAWARQLRAALEPFSTGGLYVNFPGQGEGGTRVLRASFGPNYARLCLPRPYRFPACSIPPLLP